MSQAKTMKHTGAQRKRKLKNTGNFLLNIPILLIILVPLVYTLSISLVDTDQVYKTLLLPHSIQFNNYVNAFTNPSYNFSRYILNSFIVSIILRLQSSFFTKATRVEQIYYFEMITRMKLSQIVGQKHRPRDS